MAAGPLTDTTPIAALAAGPLLTRGPGVRRRDGVWNGMIAKRRRWSSADRARPTSRPRCGSPASTGCW